MSWTYPSESITDFDRSASLSGIEVNQNQPPSDSSHGIQPAYSWYYQQFKLPSNFMRGGKTIPEISGIQIKTQVPKHLVRQATVDYILDWRNGDHWTNLSQGISLEATVHGDEVWFDIYFKKPVKVTSKMLTAKFRFGVRGRQPPPVKQVHKHLPIRSVNGKWHYYNYLGQYGNTFSTYGYEPSYANLPYHEYGFYGFPYFYKYPWWSQLTNWPAGMPFSSPPPTDYYSAALYDNWYWNYYGYPTTPANFYDSIRDNLLPLSDSTRWWNHWDDWKYTADTFPLLAFDNGVIPSDLNLADETPFPIIFQGNPSYIIKHEKPQFDEQWGFFHQYCLHTQYGLPWIWYSYPNPYAESAETFVTDANENPVLQNGNTISFMFRLLTLTGDTGTDGLGQPYRNVVVTHEADNLDTLNTTANYFANWFSKPNPSKWAVESLYFDLSDPDNNPQTFDRIWIDPLTIGPYFTVYTSNDGLPGNTVQEWEDKIWTSIPGDFQLKKKQGYVMPKPITTKYVCIEFSHLSGTQYNAPDLAQPVIYKKHPKWVLDYFLLRLATYQDPSDFIANAFSVSYNAYDLAYNYYLDDIHHTASSSAHTSDRTIQDFLTTGNDASDQINGSMAYAINTAIKPYTQNVYMNVDQNKLIGQYALNALNEATIQAGGLASEPDPANSAPQISSQVSSINRDDLVLAANYPVMYFYIPCKHIYRELSANFDKGIAYWVGIRQLAFQRDHYTNQYDADAYVESGVDSTNIELNDLIRVDNAWAVYAKASS